MENNKKRVNVKVLIWGGDMAGKIEFKLHLLHFFKGDSRSCFSGCCGLYLSTRTKLSLWAR